MKTIEWKNPNKMKFESAHKEFNRQTNYIGKGNVIANTQISGYVRGYHDEGKGLIDYPENKRAAGVLQEFDLSGFVHTPNYVKDYIRNTAKSDESVILYYFWYNSGGKSIPIGCVVTTGHTLGNKILKLFYIGRTTKSQDALDEAALYISNGFATESDINKIKGISKKSIPINTKAKAYSTNPKGWHMEPVNHALASKGIKVGKNRMKR